ncbi:MAG: PEP-utilizing enzyme [Patescibacteria group bacterium]
MAEQVLTGIAAAPGTAQGAVTVITGGQGFDDFPAGNIMVTDAVHPAQANVVKTAAALVTDSGGKTSHAAIFAREAGIPSVVGLAGATQTLKAGMTVVVDGDAGTVTVTQ